MFYSIKYLLNNLECKHNPTTFAPAFQMKEAPSDWGVWDKRQEAFFEKI